METATATAATPGASETMNQEFSLLSTGMYDL